VKNGDAVFHLFACVGNLGRLEDAIALADLLFKDHPNYPEGDYVLYFKATYLSQLGRRIEALDALGRLDSSYPNTPMRLFVDALRKDLQSQK
jgi:tetratricopeptide (TPR) repeat protein